MARPKEERSSYMTPGDVKRLYRIEKETLLEWEVKGLLTPLEHGGRRRRYLRTAIEAVLGTVSNGR